MQQSLPQLIGALDYDAYPHSILNAAQCLLESVDPSVRPFSLSSLGHNDELGIATVVK